MKKENNKKKQFKQPTEKKIILNLFRINKHYVGHQIFSES
jgi:hypothetical protein